MPELFQLIYSSKYQVDIGSHVFPTEKYLLIYEQLLKENLYPKESFIFPDAAKEEELLLVHTKEYIEKLLKGKLLAIDIMRLELPFSEKLIEASRICVQGTIESCNMAIDNGVGVHIGGGFHHAFPDHGEGFCVFNDIAIGIRSLQNKGRIKKALVIDCDLHQGNGTAFIFKNDKEVFTFSIHQEYNYPAQKPPSDIDIGLFDNADDDEYLSQLSKHIPKIVDEFRPELIVYVAGADPYENDQLGGLRVSIKGLSKRDQFIFGLCKDKNIPVAAVLAGGYAIDVEDTVRIHYNMIKTAKEILR